MVVSNLGEPAMLERIGGPSEVARGEMSGAKRPHWDPRSWGAQLAWIGRWGRRRDGRSCVAGVPDLLAKVSELAFGEEVDLDVVDDDARVTLALWVFKAPKFFAGFVGDFEDVCTGWPA